MIFKNWLDTRLKMETHDPNFYLTILGVVSRGFWTPFLDVGAQSAIFWHLKTGTFGDSPHLFAPLVKRYKQNLKKSVFWDTLLFNQSNNQDDNHSVVHNIVVVTPFVGHTVLWFLTFSGQQPQHGLPIN